MRERPLYSDYAWAYDAIVPSPAGPKTAAIAETFTKRGLSPRAVVLDAGCGTGRHAAELSHMGYEVTGMDSSRELIAIARERAPDAHFQVADLRDWTPTASFDAAICRGVLNDLIEDSDRARAVAGLHRALRRGGVLIADVREWNTMVERYTKRPVFEREAGEVTFVSETTLDPASHTLRVRERIDDGEPFEFAMRCWTRDELESTLRAAGFTEVEITADDRLVAVAVA